eukprot:13183525-Alexandrium_andersonii.AAC.1
MASVRGSEAMMEMFRKNPKLMLFECFYFRNVQLRMTRRLRRKVLLKQRVEQKKIKVEELDRKATS